MVDGPIPKLPLRDGVAAVPTSSEIGSIGSINQLGRIPDRRLGDGAVSIGGGEDERVQLAAPDRLSGVGLDRHPLLLVLRCRADGDRLFGDGGATGTALADLVVDRLSLSPRNSA